MNLNPWLEVRDRLVENHAQVVELRHMLTIIFWLCVVGVGLVIVQTVLKIVIDRRQERRYGSMLKVVEEHGAVTDRQKERTERMAQVSVGAARIVSKATKTVEQRYEELATEVHDIKTKLDEIIAANKSGT